jgi:hypothetical protein
MSLCARFGRQTWPAAEQKSNNQLPSRLVHMLMTSSVVPFNHIMITRVLFQERPNITCEQQHTISSGLRMPNWILPTFRIGAREKACCSISEAILAVAYAQGAYDYANSHNWFTIICASTCQLRAVAPIKIRQFFSTIPSHAASINSLFQFPSFPTEPCHRL